MLMRIVKLNFRQDKIQEFLKIFEGHRETIKSFSGFSGIELYQEKSKPEVFFTHSLWEDEAALENYRKSDYFHVIWSRIKVLFADKPEAWSLEKKV